MHLDSETALDLVEETTGEDERRFWDGHIERCSQCAAKLQDWSAFARWVKRSHLLNAPQEVLASVRKIFATHANVRSDAA